MLIYFYGLPTRIIIALRPALSLVSFVRHRLAKRWANFLKSVLYIYSVWCVKDFFYFFTNFIQNCHFDTNKFMHSFKNQFVYVGSVKGTTELCTNSLYQNYLSLPLQF